MAQGKNSARCTQSDFIRGDDFIAQLPAAERAAIDARAAELIAEHLTLRDLRKARAALQAKGKPAAAPRPKSGKPHKKKARRKGAARGEAE